MIKIFFATFFIAELIIAFAAITKICQFNKSVKSMDKLITANKYKIKVAMSDIRVVVEDFNKFLDNFKLILRRKQQEYIIKLSKNVIVYLSFFLLKGRYKKTVIVYQFLSEVCDGLNEIRI